ncbi:MAG TPA: type II toxin-antitoxin system PemK/MazF family toxin [Tepidisphaeraceae bacterium]|nr:type II toxin-antitoxin system PemK/MazF family toxin [Tepidisphaeraceae bacterium]
MKKTRPCLIIGPNEMNDYVHTVIIAPLTSTIRRYRWRVACRFGGREGQIALDQMRWVDHLRLIKRIGTLDSATRPDVRETLQKMFE